MNPVTGYPADDLDHVKFTPIPVHYKGRSLLQIYTTAGAPASTVKSSTSYDAGDLSKITFVPKSGYYTGTVTTTTQARRG
jgi:hypothetical protein